MLNLFKKRTKSHIGRNLSGQPATVTVIGNGENQQLVGLKLHITEKCNYACKHCYMSSNPNVEDALKKEDIFSVVGQLSNNHYHATGVLITGGEPFLHHDLDSIIEHTSKRIRPLIIFTNGYWVSDIYNTKRRLKELRKLGCEHIKFSINDKYHKEFIGEEKRKVILGIYQNPEKGFPLIELNHEKDEVNPQGNAVFLPKEALKINEENNADLFDDWDFHFNTCSLPLKNMFGKIDLNIRASGEVYPCNWFVKSLGNIKKDSIKAIVDNYLTDKEYNTIADKGPQTIARHRGMREEEIKARFIENPCKLCHDIYNIKSHEVMA